MNYLAIEINENCSIFDAENLMKVCFIGAYMSEKEDGKKVLIVPAHSGNCLAYAKTAAGFLQTTIRGYGIRADGSKFSLLRDKETLDEPVLVSKT